jgi:hypothetical protein
MPRQKLAMTARFRRAAHVEIREVGDEYFAVALGSGATHNLNKMASAVWRALAKPRTAEEIVLLFQAAFPDTPTRKMARDIAHLLANLEHNKLIVRLKSRSLGKSALRRGS